MVDANSCICSFAHDCSAVCSQGIFGKKQTNGITNSHPAVPVVYGIGATDSSSDDEDEDNSSQDEAAEDARLEGAALSDDDDDDSLDSADAEVDNVSCVMFWMASGT